MLVPVIIKLIIKLTANTIEESEQQIDNMPLAIVVRYVVSHACCYEGNKDAFLPNYLLARKCIGLINSFSLSL